MHAYDFSGQLEFTGRGADKVWRSDAVIYFEPDIDTDTDADTTASVKDRVAPEDEGASPETAKVYSMAMARKRFAPRVLPVPVGSSVALPNRDKIVHNAFSPSKPNNFDTGLYQRGDGKSVTFTDPGVVRVYCNVHYNMVGYVLVLDTPYYTQPDQSGKFELRDLPVGPGTLTIWHERSKPLSIRVEGRIQPQDFVMKVGKRRIPKHKNKFGSSYKKRKKYRRY